MRASELRIGNLVESIGTNGNPDKFVQINIKSYHLQTCERNPELFRPIALTEQWLHKFGFKKDPMNPRIYRNGIEIYNSDDGKFRLNEYCEFGQIENPEDQNEIKSVHRLQNIFFALIEKELEICE